MELDDLKDNWKKETTPDTATALNMDQLQYILRNKTSNLLISIKKKYEKIITILLLGMLLYIFIMPILTDGFTYPGAVNGFTKGMFFHLVVLIFYWEKLKTINNLTLSDGIKERLEQLLTKLKHDKRNELRFIALFFVGVAAIGRFVYGKGLNGILNTDVIVATILAIGLTGVAVFFIIKRYNKQIAELQLYLSEYTTNAS